MNRVRIDLPFEHAAVGPAKDEGPIGCDADAELVAVVAVMVVTAQEHQVRKVRPAAPEPVPDVMGLEPFARTATGVRAAPVPVEQRPEQPPRHHALRAAEVEHRPVPAQQGGAQPGRAEQPLDHGTGQPGTAGNPGMHSGGRPRLVIVSDTVDRRIGPRRRHGRPGGVEFEMHDHRGPLVTAQMRQATGPLERHERDLGEALKSLGASDPLGG